MRRPNSQRSDVHRSMALKLTIFTATEITTASRWAAIRADAAANTQTGAVDNCVELDLARRSRLRAHPDSGLSLDTEPLRMPIPANDNITLSYMPKK